MDKTMKNDPILSQILLSVVDKTAYLGGSVCTWILSNQWQLGLQAETVKQEGYFNCGTQLLDRQELLRSSRNLNQKTTPRHKEHSNSLYSQDHILRTQVCLCARPALLENRQHKLSGNIKIAEIRHQKLRLPCARKQVDEIRLCRKFQNFSPDVTTLARRVFLTHNKLIRKPRYVEKKTHSCMVWNSRIVKIYPGLAGISIGKMSSNGPKTLQRPLFAESYLVNPSSVSHKSKTLRERVAQAFRWYQERRKPTSGARSNTRANTDKKWEKMDRRSDAFFSRTTTFARRVFPTHNELIREPWCVGKMTNPAMTCNSWFAGGFPRLTGILAGKTRKNSSGTPTSGSHNSPVWTPIRANFISLESRHWEISDNMLHDPFWIPEGLQNSPQKLGQKRVRTKLRRIRWRSYVEDKIAMWQGYELERDGHASRAMDPCEACNPGYK